MSRDYTWPVTSVNREDFIAATECAAKLKNGNKPIVIFGAGIRGCMVFKIFKKEKCEITAFSDNNMEKWGGVVCGKEIISPDMLYKMRGQVRVVISVENGHSIKTQLEEHGFKENLDYFYLYTNSYDWYMEQFHLPLKEHLLVLGDCGFLTISMMDKNDETLGDLIIKKFGPNKTKVLAMHGLGMRAHYNVLKTQLYLGWKPKRIIIMVNFDTFTGKQHLLPRSQHTDLIKRIWEESNFNDQELLEYVKLTKKRFNNVQTEFFINGELDKNRKDINNKNKLYFRLNYMYKLNKQNEGVQYLLKIINICLRENIQVIPYIPPVNYKLAEKFWGNIFLEKYNYNLNLIKNLISEKGISILDMSYLLVPNEFAEINTPDETCNFAGRCKILEQLVNNLCLNKGER